MNHILFCVHLSGFELVDFFQETVGNIDIECGADLIGGGKYPAASLYSWRILRMSNIWPGSIYALPAPRTRFWGRIQWVGLGIGIALAAAVVWHWFIEP